MKQRSYYMHTLNGYAAFFNGEIISVLAEPHNKPYILAKSLKQIKAEQATNKKHYKQVAYCSLPEFGSLRVCLPVEESKL